MKPSTIASTLLPLLSCSSGASAAAVPPSPGTTNPNNASRRIPTSYESAVLGRRILALTPIGTLSTVFPKDNKDKDNDDDDSAKKTVVAVENRPAGLGGMPYGLMEYISDCEQKSQGNPTILAITIGTTFKNAAAGSNVSLAVEWRPPHPPAKRIKSKTSSSWLSYLGLGNNHLIDDDDDNAERDISLPYSAANLPRFSLLGHLEPIQGGDGASELARCYVRSHPDARYWLPGNKIHESHFVRLVVEQVYWVGGFGDRAYIGWIPVEEWYVLSIYPLSFLPLPS
jgi:hypothetical protein